MAGYNIGPKIGIEGEKEFRAQINRINQEYKTLTAQTNAVVAGFDKVGDTQGKLRAKSEQLEKLIAKQREKMEQLEGAVAKASAQYGEHSIEATRLAGVLADTEATVSKLEKELADTDDELKRMAEGFEDVGDEAAQADDKLLSFGDVLKAGVASGAILGAIEQAADVIVDIGSAAIESAAEVKAANAQFSQTFGDLQGTATNALRSISNETGIAVTRLQGGYTALYAFTKSVGGDQQTALNIAQRALSAAADSAAYYDRTMEDATETLQSFLKGNYENDAALGIAATETTRNAKANELYAKSFNELTEAQKVDTLLAMVEAGNAASGALGQAAREADSWANVTGELGEAWRQMLAVLGSPVLEGLTPIIQGITGAINELISVSSWEKLNTSVAGFQQGVRDAETALADSNAEMQAAAGLSQQYVSRLREIEGAGLDSAEAQAEYARTVELLNGLMPELGLTINSVTGRLDQNTWAIADNIDALQAQAKAQAQQEYYADIIAQQVAVEKELVAARLRQSELMAREQVLLDQGAVAHEGYTAAQLGSAGAAADLSASMSDADRELMSIQRELAATNGAITQGEETVAAYAAQLDAARAATEGLSSGTAETTAATDELSKAVADAQTAYLDMKTAARESIDSQIGLFDELDTKSEQSAKKIVENWGKQQDAFANYSDNLRKAVEMGLDEALVQQLSDGSQESMQILHEFVNGTEMSIDEINAAFRGLDEAKDEVSDTMAYIASMADGTYEKMAKAAKEAGYDTVEGLVAGIRNNSGILENAMRDMGKKAQIAFNRVMQIQSPSKVMERSGGYVVAGAVQGVERNVRDLEAAMADMARAGNAAYLQEQLDYVAQYPSMVARAPGYGGGSTTNNSHVAYGGINITINTQPGQDAHSIADVVLEVLTFRLGQEEARF